MPGEHLSGSGPPRPRVATRGSELALRQAAMAVEALRAHGAGGAELVTVRTEGDQRPEPLARIAGKGVFVKEVDDLVLAGQADLAVHSCKDIPTELHEGLTLAAVLPRGPAHDVLIAPAPLAALPAGARVGTSSPRRGAQLKHHRPDVTVVDLRGNVPTRVTKVGQDGLDAAVLAAAGLERLGLQPSAGRGLGLHAMPLDAFPTAPGQGAVAIVARAGSETAALAARADHPPTRAAVEVERAVLHELGTGCATPLGCHAAWEGAAHLRVVAQLLAPDGQRVATLTRRVPAAEHLERAQELGVELARRGVEVLGKW